MTRNASDKRPSERPAGQPTDRKLGRRAFLRRGVAAAGTATVGGILLNRPLDAFAQRSSEGLTPGDAAILRFLAAAEILETDAWQQYNELGGIQDAEVPGGSGNPAYTAALKVLDGDMDQYIHDNTENEMTHELFLNAYLAAHRKETVNLDKFRTLPSSKATGAQQIGRLTNLMQLTLDTSWWTRYRDPNHNPDLDPNFVFPRLFRVCTPGSFREFHGPTRTSALPTTSRPSLTRRGSTFLPSSRVELAFIRRWPRESRTLKPCGSF